MLLTIADGEGASAVIAPALGAWLLRYTRQLAGRNEIDALHYTPEVLDRYPREIYAGNPLLFPLASFNHLPGHDHHYEWQGQRFPMPQHGFARRMPWRVVEQAPDAVAMELADTDATRTQYPFQFVLRLTYRVERGRLLWKLAVTNRSRTPMPFSTGFHPYFAVPLSSAGSRAGCFVEVPEARRFTIHGRGEHFSAKPFPAQNWSVDEDVSTALFLGDLHKRELILADPASGLEVALNWEGAPNHRFAAFWSRSTDAPFYCLEPWTALSNVFTRANERELVVLAPYQTFEAEFWMELREIE